MIAKNLTKQVFTIVGAILILTACGDGSDNDGDVKSIGSKDFSFNVAIDPETLTKEDFFIVEESSYVMGDASAIGNEEDLDAVNEKLSPDEQLVLPELENNYYFFVKDVQMPSFSEYSDHSYDDKGPRLTITIDFFRYTGATPAIHVPQRYYVFEAEKVK